MSHAYPQSIHSIPHDGGSAPAPQLRTYVGRPDFVWRNDPELARKINDHLAADARDSTD